MKPKTKTCGFLVALFLTHISGQVQRHPASVVHRPPSVNSLGAPQVSLTVLGALGSRLWARGSRLAAP